MPSKKAHKKIHGMYTRAPQGKNKKENKKHSLPLLAT